MASFSKAPPALSAAPCSLPGMRRVLRVRLHCRGTLAKRGIHQLFRLDGQVPCIGRCEMNKKLDTKALKFATL
jgi:hypothetical protein